MGAENRFRLATFNIRTGTALDGRNIWPLRRESTARTIVDLDADVLGLQEVLGCQRRWLMRRLPGHSFHGSGRSRRRRGEASPVVVRNGPLTVHSVVTRWFGDTPERPGSRIEGSTLPRIATTATLRLPSEDRVTVTNVHLDHRSESARSVATAQLLEWLDLDAPQVIMGDFNAAINRRSVRTLLDNGFRSVLPESAAGTFHGFTGRARPGAIDHILVSRHFRVVEACVVERPDLRPLPSDHWPIVATLEFAT